MDIGEGVRNGEFTVEQAERLHASWIVRNRATQSKSLKERKDAINDLRNQFQTVLKTAKVKRERSILDRIKHKVRPKRKKSIPEEPACVMQITVRYKVFIGEGLSGCLTPGHQ